MPEQNIWYYCHYSMFVISYKHISSLSISIQKNDNEIASGVLSQIEVWNIGKQFNAMIIHLIQSLKHRLQSLENKTTITLSMSLTYLLRLAL